jgi:glycosyltransferase involved in cell wall biosynthesis
VESKLLTGSPQKRLLNLTVITVTYNCARSIRVCLDSVAQQSYPNRKHVVVDGASTDGTLGILQSHRAQIETLLSEPDHGIYDALNKGIANATGEVIGLLHADDLYASDQVLATVAAVFENPNVQAVYGDLQYVSRVDVSRVIRHWRAGEFSQAKLARGWMPPHPTLFLRRGVYDKLAGSPRRALGAPRGDAFFNTRYRIAADYDFMLRVLGGLKLDQVVYLPEVLVKMRVGGASNRSLKAIIRKSAEDYRILRANGFSICGAAGALAWKNLSKGQQL